jgi:SAM-dependent methyltransferase
VDDLRGDLVTVLLETTNTPHAWTERALAGGPSWEAAGWSARGQHGRFAAVARHLAGRVAFGDRVLDYGCGTGAFSMWLPDTIEYLAHDWSDGMLARVAAEHPRSHILDEIPVGLEVDHTVVIGTFNLPGSITRAQVQLQSLWERTRKTMVASVYRGADSRCLQWEPRDLAVVAAAVGCDRFLIDGTHLTNDLILVMHRETA